MRHARGDEYQAVAGAGLFIAVQPDADFTAEVLRVFRIASHEADDVGKIVNMGIAHRSLGGAAPQPRAVHGEVAFLDGFIRAHEVGSFNPRHGVLAGAAAFTLELQRERTGFVDETISVLGLRHQFPAFLLFSFGQFLFLGDTLFDRYRDILGAEGEMYLEFIDRARPCPIG